MLVSSLVVTLSTDAVARAGALAGLAAAPGLTIGQAVRDRLPVVAEAETAEGAEALVRALGELAGVVRVDVVAIDFPEHEDSGDGERTARSGEGAAL